MEALTTVCFLIVVKSIKGFYFVDIFCFGVSYDSLTEKEVDVIRRAKLMVWMAPDPSIDPCATVARSPGSGRPAGNAGAGLRSITPCRSPGSADQSARGGQNMGLLSVKRSGLKGSDLSGNQQQRLTD